MKIQIDSFEERLKGAVDIERIYVVPRDSKTALAVRKIFKNDNLTYDNMEQLRTLGHTFEWITEDDAQLQRVEAEVKEYQRCW